MQVAGLDIFDRRYPGLVLDEGVKVCVKILLARGAPGFPPEKPFNREAL